MADCRFCGEAFSPTTLGQAYCRPRCAIEGGKVRKGRPPSEVMVRECAVCKATYQATRKESRTCGPACAAKNKHGKRERVGHARECLVCTRIFTSPQPSAKVCVECRPEYDRQRKRAGTHAVKEELSRQNSEARRGVWKPPVVRSAIPCQRCIHWKHNPAGVYGGECVIAFWNRCTPLKPGATPFAPVRADA